MILISRKVDYAILILCDLARENHAASARGLAEKYTLSRPFIANILKDLCKDGLVASERGAKGGYRLARTPDQISLASIITTLEGPFRLMSCAGGDQAPAADCSLFQVCPTKSPLQAVHQKLLATLEQVTLSELAACPQLVRLEGEKQPNGCPDLSRQ